MPERAPASTKFKVKEALVIGNLYCEIFPVDGIFKSLINIIQGKLTVDNFSELLK